MEDEADSPRTVVFFHPDLGIGGAERLVVDAAVGLQQRGHKVVIFTSYCDPNHCFEECRDGTLDVRVRGNWPVPASVFGRLTILCAILRQFHLIVQIYLTSELQKLEPDLLIVDQLSAGIPILQYLFLAPHILFYCHFPDLLLARGREHWWKRLYRVPFDSLEEWSMGFAHAVAVNSEFTKSIVRRTWPRMTSNTELRVVYPCVTAEAPASELEDDAVVWRDEQVILSINRFERKKDIGLAIRAFAALDPERRKGARLVIAGGYDPRVSENVQYHTELVTLAESLHLSTMTAKTVISALAAPPPDTIPVLFLLSIPAALKTALLRSASLLIYTPANEHFGIVPLEAMQVGVPVLAANTGGPLETVLDGKTGWLRDPTDVPQWTKVLDQVLNKLSSTDRQKMARAGAHRVKTTFGRQQMAQRFEEIIEHLEGVGRRNLLINSVMNIVGLFLVFGLGLFTAQIYSLLFHR